MPTTTSQRIDQHTQHYLTEFLAFLRVDTSSPSPYDGGSPCAHQWFNFNWRALVGVLRAGIWFFFVNALLCVFCSRHGIGCGSTLQQTGEGKSCLTRFFLWLRRYRTGHTAAGGDGDAAESSRSLSSEEDTNDCSSDDVSASVGDSAGAGGLDVAVAGTSPDGRGMESQHSSMGMASGMPLLIEGSQGEPLVMTLQIPQCWSGITVGVEKSPEKPKIDYCASRQRQKLQRKIAARLEQSGRSDGPSCVAVEEEPSASVTEKDPLDDETAVEALLRELEDQPGKSSPTGRSKKKRRAAQRQPTQAEGSHDDDRVAEELPAASAAPSAAPSTLPSSSVAGTSGTQAMSSQQPKETAVPVPKRSEVTAVAAPAAPLVTPTATTEVGTAMLSLPKRVPTAHKGGSASHAPASSRSSQETKADPRRCKVGDPCSAPCQVAGPSSLREEVVARNSVKEPEAKTSSNKPGISADRISGSKNHAMQEIAANKPDSTVMQALKTTCCQEPQTVVEAVLHESKTSTCRSTKAQRKENTMPIAERPVARDLVSTESASAAPQQPRKAKSSAGSPTAVPKAVSRQRLSAEQTARSANSASPKETAHGPKRQPSVDTTSSSKAALSTVQASPSACVSAKSPSPAAPVAQSAPEPRLQAQPQSDVQAKAQLEAEQMHKPPQPQPQELEATVNENGTGCHSALPDSWHTPLGFALGSMPTEIRFGDFGDDEEDP
eukprot:gnl/TRDRNA2_/TRDRNA2_195296_c0_seq1.p1 gnl/TRDRNA2_/TRDRNA2_195296_c0~~gnl/TRDRNA2_/TRDRNA2_195296_c0_seq1.p1  ORF type:complete len:834 (+),score=121.73 gnl/TRDRNA2_/TRDRNA2_195296_c0_seq1:348-2504(+)